MIKKTILVLFFISLSVIPSAWGIIPELEKLALDELYESTNGDQWLQNDGWNESDVCKRWGVTCNSDNSHVIGLKLFYNQLQGSLPNNLGNLKQLQTLFLAGNAISGTLPQSMGELSFLTHLDLSDNQLQGSIFSSLEKLSKLSFLAISNNHLSGEIPETILNLSGLIHLNLSENNLSGNIPVSIWQLPNLNNLNLSGNQFIGDVLSECSSAKYLSYLNLSNNGFTGTIPPCIGELRSLSSLYLSDNKFSGTIPSAISQLSNLVYLYLEHNSLEGNIPEFIGILYLLQTLRLNNNNLSGLLPESLGNLNQLIRLDLSNNKLTGIIPESLGNLAQLQSLYLNNNCFTGTLPDELSQCQNLKVLFIAANKIQGPIPDEWIALTSLNNSYSDFRWNALWTKNSSVKSFMDNKQQGEWETTQTTPPTSLKVEIISDSSINLSWVIPDFHPGPGKYEIYYAHDVQGPFQLFFEITDYQTQTITFSNIEPCISYYFKIKTITYPHSNNSNQVDSTFSEMVSVSILSDFNQLERDALLALYQSTDGENWINQNAWMGVNGSECSWYGIECNSDKNHVIGIQLASNKLEGELPEDIKKLSHLLRLDLRDNQLNGNIPTTIGEMKSLVHLDLSANNFEGNIPDTIGQLNDLESLMLYDNELSGIIPKSLSALTSLKRLYLEKNHLSGSLPQELSLLLQLEKIRIHSNQLIGEIPGNFALLSSLINDSSDFRWNGLYSNNPTLVNFLNICQRDNADWTKTQNIPPKNIYAGSAQENGITLFWTPIPYSVDSGGYEIYKSENADGPFQMYHTTVDKTVSSFLLSDLTPNTPSYFRIRTITRPHNNNSNTLESLFSPDLSIVYTRNFPWISDISNQTIYQNSYIDISFSVGDDTGSQQNLNVSALSSNAGLVPWENLIISGSNTSKILRVSS
ncbi:LRR receptor-like serine/threonine-protein kinase GSO1, partial [Candidatus Magnetomorum sp. HK-1]